MRERGEEGKPCKIYKVFVDFCSDVPFLWAIMVFENQCFQREETFAEDQ